MVGLPCRNEFLQNVSLAIEESQARITVRLNARRPESIALQAVKKLTQYSSNLLWLFPR